MDNHPEEAQSPEDAIAFPTELSAKAKQILESIQRLQQPYQWGQRKEQILAEADRLGVTTRTIYTYQGNWEDAGLIGLVDEVRADKGNPVWTQSCRH